MRTMCEKEGPHSKKPTSPLWSPLSCGCRCFSFFCRWNLAPHPLPPACQGDSREWIHSKGSGQRLLLGWTFPELGSAAGSMHQKISNFSSLLWPVFHTDYYYPHAQHPHVSICQSDICASTISVSKDSIWGTTKRKGGILWLSCLVESRFYCTVCRDVLNYRCMQWKTVVLIA